MHFDYHGKSSTSQTIFAHIFIKRWVKSYKSMEGVVPINPNFNPSNCRSKMPSTLSRWSAPLPGGHVSHAMEKHVTKTTPFRKHPEKSEKTTGWPKGSKRLLSFRKLKQVKICKSTLFEPVLLVYPVSFMSLGHTSHPQCHSCLAVPILPRSSGSSYQLHQNEVALVYIHFQLR